jgi:hypothetical protein
MSLCGLCGLVDSFGRGLCEYHSEYFVDDWAKSNRIVCDFIHRHIEWTPLSVEDRLADGYAELAASVSASP